MRRRQRQSNISQREDAALFGFVEVRPVRNAGGEEQFGVVEIAPDFTVLHEPQALTLWSRRHNTPEPFLTAGLRLSGANLNLWLSDEPHEREFWQNLGRALPDTPVEFILRRRQGSLEQHYAAWQEAVSNRLPDEAVRFAFLEDYLENFIYAVEDANPATLWAGVLVSGRGETQVSERLAALFAALSALGCEATPLNTADLTTLLLDYYNPTLSETDLGEVQPGDLPLVEPAIGESAIFTGMAQSFWKIVAPPSPREGGWVQTLLERAPAEAEFDLVAHIGPTTATGAETMLEVLRRRSANLKTEINQVRAAGNAVLYHDLLARYREINGRLQQLENGQERFFEVGLTLALRDTAEDLPRLEAVFTQALQTSGIATQMVEGAHQVEQAWHTCAPLNLARLPRPFVVPSQEAGRLIQLAATPIYNATSPNLAMPLLGLNRAGEPVYVPTDLQPGQFNLFFTGNPGANSVQPARNLVKYLAAMFYLRGERLLGFDALGDWRRLTQQLGGTFVGFGPENPTVWHYNPLQFIGLPQGSATLEAVENWSEQTATFLATILNLPPAETNEEATADSLREQLHRLLIQMAFANSNAFPQPDEVLTAPSLYEAAVNNGYGELAQTLERCIKNGDLAWLFEGTTRLSPLFQAQDQTLLFLGFSPTAEKVLTPAARATLLAKIYAYFNNVPVNPFAKSRLLIFDNAEALLTEPDSNRRLYELLNNEAARPKSFNTWFISTNPIAWLSHRTGQANLEQAANLYFFKQTGPGMVGVAKRLGLTSRVQRAIREVAAGGAIVAERVALHQYQVEMFRPVAQSYIARLSQAHDRKSLPAQPQEQISSRPAQTANVPAPVIVVPPAPNATRPNVSSQNRAAS